MRRTKIVCTLGPATDREGVLKTLLENGLDVARLNFSHGSHEEHGERIERIRGLCAQLGRNVPLLLDTKGPEVRLGDFAEGSVELKRGDLIALSSEPCTGSRELVAVSYPYLARDVQIGERILADDGNLELRVEQVEGNRVICRALNGGVLGSRKSLHVPSASEHLPAITEKDEADLRFGIENDFDFIALSFVRKASDVRKARNFLEEHGGGDIRIVAKIENRQGVENIDEILRVADGIMVARGDLGMDIPLSEVPVVQRNLIERCYRSGKPVITATQMLDSMMRNPRPTRAETNDVATAIHEGTSALMLSGETAAGPYPLEALRMMVDIAVTTEASIDYWEKFRDWRFDMSLSVTNAISYATCSTAMHLGASAIITVTKSGTTARMLSRFRPECPVIASTTSRKVFRQLVLSWGVWPVFSPEVHSTDELFHVAMAAAEETGLVAHGDVTVITAGVPVGVSGTTNLVKVQMVGNVLARGRGVGKGFGTGEVCVAKTAEEALERFQPGNILVMHRTCHELVPLMRSATAIVVEEDGEECHAATVGIALDIPVVVGVSHATELLRSGTVVRVDAPQGIVECVGEDCAAPMA